MTQNTYTIHEYDHRFDAGLAVMWNESDDQWPGTFTEGVPLTEERVREWMDRIEAVMRLIVVEDQTGLVVGYGDLWDTAVRPHSCYVALLNVHPAHQGRSLARRMLVHMVNWAVENGYDRITIGTWPANLKAMPLYKKVGFFWKPGTSVYMENYLTAARILPAARPFFERHDWYRTYTRDLSQVEDDCKHPFTGEMDVYTLRWEEDGDFLEAVFDRNAQALTGIETCKWAAYARTGSAEPAKGLRYPFEWEIANRSSEPLPVSLEAAGDEGIVLLEKTSFVLQPGENRLVHSRFFVELQAPEYPGHHEDMPTPRIRTMLQLNGTPLELGTGLRYRTAFEVSSYPAGLTLSPGIPQSVHLQVRNRTLEHRKGVLRLDLPEGLTAGWTEHNFETPAQGFAGIEVQLTAVKEGFYPLKACVVFEDEGEEIVQEAVLLPVAAPAPGRWTAGEGDGCLVLENDFVRITANSKAGEAMIWNRDTQREEARLMEEIGPAFVPWDLHEQEYDLALHIGQDEARAIMTVRSTRFPGLVVGREITVGASPLIRVRGWVANNTEKTFSGLILRPHVQVSNENLRMVTAPLKERTVRAHGSQFGTIEEDLPKKPERYHEQWLAYDSEGRAFGLVWKDDGVREMFHENGRHFFMLPSPVAPGETRWSIPLYMYAGPGDWRAVQQAWRRLTGDVHAPTSRPDDVREPLVFELAPRPLATLGSDILVRLHAASTREYRLTGRISVRLPDGWRADLEAQALDVNREHALDVPLRLSPAPELPLGVGTGKLVFESQAFDRETSFRLVRLGDAAESVAVEEAEEAGQPVLRIANGHSRWTAAPGFHGGITTWQSAASGMHQLLTSFPSDGELAWMKPFFGGIRPVLFDPDGSGWPGKLHRERFSAETVAAADASGFTWQGVRLKTTVEAEGFRGLQLELDYLTLPGSNVLRAVYRVTNCMPAYRRLQMGWLAFAQVDGAYTSAKLHTAAYSRNRSPQHSWGLHETWAAVENPETGRTLLALHADPAKRLQAIDMGENGAHVFVRQTVDVPPDGAVELAAFFILADNLEQARQYAEAGL